MAVPEASLSNAARNCYNDLYPFFTGVTAKAKIATFWQALTSTFSDDTADDHPPANWIAVIAAYNNKVSVAYNIAQFGQIVQFIYQFLLFCDQYTLISAGQKAAVLASFNTAFA